MFSDRNFILVTLLLLGTIVYLEIRPTGTIVPQRWPLEDFPHEIGTWKGMNVPIEEKIIRVLGVEDYLSRTYETPDGKVTHLYVGYYQTQRQGDSVHSPKNCLPGSGWEPFEVGYETFDFPGHLPIKVNRYLIEKGREKQVVYYWYQSNGRIVASEYWGKIFLVLNALTKNRTDGALVRVIAPVYTSVSSAEESARQFIRDTFPLLDQFIPK